MAFATIVHSNPLEAIETVTVTATTTTDDDVYNFRPEYPIRAMTILAIGGGGNNFGSGTVELKASNDGVTFFSLPTVKTITSDGIKSVAVSDCGFLWYQISLSGSTDPTLTIVVSFSCNH
jgi:hypothetical protein